METRALTATLLLVGLASTSSCGSAYRPVTAARDLDDSPRLVIPCSETGHVRQPEYGERVAVDRVAEPRSKVAPVYPDRARQAGIDGTVTIAALICEHGHATELRIVKSIPALDRAALEAVRQWTFVAATSSGIPVPSWIEIPIRFTLH
jgi:TonB family protein